MPPEEATTRPFEPDELVGQARQMHSQLDGMRQWSRRNAARLEERARLVEDGLLDSDDVKPADELRELAAVVRTVTERIEQGDINKVRETEE